MTERRTWALVRYFLYLGTFGFGGPVALVGYMQRDLVERRGWFTREDYLKGLALSQLAPGPLAAQLAMCLGYAHGRAAGATVIGLAFILPSFLMTLGLGALYVAYGGLGWMQAAFYGVGAAVIGIIVRSAWKLLRLTMGGDRLLWIVAGLTALITARTEAEIGALFILAGVAVMLAQAPPRRLAVWSRGRSLPALAWPLLFTAGLAAPAAAADIGRIFWFFTQAGAFVFGSGLAIVPFLHGGVVRDYGWLTDRQFLDAVAVAMLTPGPVVITVTFIGYLVAGLAGGAAAAVGVFLPTYLFVVIPYPWFDRMSGSPQVKAFVRGVTAAAAGAIAGACVVLGRRAIVDPPTALIALAALGLQWRLRVAEPVLIGGAALAGLLIFWLRGLS
jgi:chromate transporter